MKTKKKELVFAIFLGVITGLVGDWIWEQRAHVFSWIQNNPLLASIIFVIIVAIGCYFLVK